jgi:large subunit ribosomal protein L4
MATNVNVYNLNGEVIEKVDLPEIFDIVPNDILLSQYVRVYLANQRQGTRSTKDRSQVNGRAKKPHKQKGTGSARHGSRKAPSMRGGGVAHGPRPQNFSLKMSKTQRFNALVSAYAKRKENCYVLSDSNIEIAKTKTVVNFLDKVNLNNSTLFVTTGVQKNLVLSSRNVQKVSVVTAATVNPYELMKATNIVIEKSVLDLMHSPSEVEAKKGDTKLKKDVEVKADKTVKTKTKIST